MRAIVHRESNKVDSMSISAVSHAIPQYQAPQTPQAKTDDERNEPMAVKTKEAQTGKDSPVPAQKSAVDIKA
jgi:hypothetical protein